MTDTISAERRSALMGRIRGAGNESTEVALAKILCEAGLSGWRRQQHIGWTVPRVWEHELERPDRLARWLVRNV